MPIALPNANQHLANGIPEYEATDRLYITIIGGHGAGKTFMACALWDILTGGISLDLSAIALGESIRAHSNGQTLLIGKYGSERKCGGMDSIRTDNNRLYTAIELAMKRHERVVISEGMTINSQMMMRWLVEHKDSWERRIIYIHLMPDHDEQVTRILRRSGRTNIKEKYVKMKSDQFERNDAYLHLNFPSIPVIRIACRYTPFSMVSHALQYLKLYKLIERTHHDKGKEDRKRTIRVRRNAVRRAQHRSHK